MNTKVRWLMLLSLVVLAGVLLSGCGAEAEPTSTSVPGIFPTAVVNTTPLQTSTQSPPVATVTPTLVVTAVPPPPPPSPTPPCTNQAAFVADVTIPDGTLVAPGKTFVKTWRLQNIGSCTWSAGYALIFADGNPMGGPSAVPFPGTVPPGNTVDLSVALTAPAGLGAYSGSWRLRSDKGEIFGLGPNADVFIVAILVGVPTVTPAPGPPTATPSVYPNWRGEYFAGMELKGTPVLVRDDEKLDFAWDNSAPAPVVPADQFSVRWTRTLDFAAGLYRFDVTVDDGMRLFVDDVKVLDAWMDGPPRLITGTYYLSEGPHPVRVEYYENAGQATLQVSWHRLTVLGWLGEYWANAGLEGPVALARVDPVILFDWGEGSPAPVLPADNFSARWTRTDVFEATTYRFHLRVTGGARLYLDDQLILDGWLPGAPRELIADRTLAAGEHRLRVEYFNTTGAAQIQAWWEVLASNGLD